jgi:hypothetical protein
MAEVDVPRRAFPVLALKGWEPGRFPPIYLTVEMSAKDV